MDKETSEIAGLTERVSKDPKSKLFVPLAEEYRKAGDIEMAIHVLLEGLKNNPDYVTARSSLGKFLLVKGDIAGAQKEFEEIVKTIPDNLLAQKKLGDIYVFQNRPLDALSHYKTVLSFNPKDEGLATLISEVEAGQDVRSKIQISPAKTTTEQEVKQEPPKAVAAPAPAPVSSPSSKIVEPVKPVEVPAESQPASPAPFAEAAVPAAPVTEKPEEPEEVPFVEPSTLVADKGPEPVSAPVSNAETVQPIEIPPPSQASSPAILAEVEQATGPSVMETEEPEEVLIVEPLDPVASIRDLPEPGVELLKGVEPEAVPSVAAEKSDAFDFSADSLVQEGPAVSEDVVPALVPEVVPEMEVIKSEDAETSPVGISEQTPVTASETADDFQTDTLAELYIAQGFFEKAVEIYERMLVDKPNSQGLQDKLAWVRAEAAKTAAPAAEATNAAPDILAAQEMNEYVPAAETKEVDAGEIFDGWGEGAPQLELRTDDPLQEATAKVKADVPAVEPEEIAVEAEVLTETSEVTPEMLFPEDDGLAKSSEHQSAAKQREQTTVARDAGFDAVEAAPVQEKTRPKPQFTDFEPREYVPPGAPQGAVKAEAGKENAAPTAGFDGRKQTITRLETWLTTIKKEK
jgi:hypothetical protein